MKGKSGAELKVPVCENARHWFPPQSIEEIILERESLKLPVAFTIPQGLGSICSQQWKEQNQVVAWSPKRGSRNKAGEDTMQNFGKEKQCTCLKNLLDFYLGSLDMSQTLLADLALKDTNIHNNTHPAQSMLSSRTACCIAIPTVLERLSVHARNCRAGEEAP